MAEKNMKDYLHLYLGCQCKNNIEGVAKLTGLSYDDTQRQWWAYFEGTEFGYCPIEEIKPILRPLPDMTDEERDFRWNNFINIKVIDQIVVAEEIRWLLSKQFDLFNLIPEGLAIDKNEMK